jgi:chromosome segregation ATPase
MEPTQTAQMVAWLDEERRKDKALIAKLEERTSSQAALLEDQARRIQTLEGELAALRSTTPTISFFDETIARLRSELNVALEQAESRRNAIEQDAKKVRELDREAMTRALDDIRQEVSNRLERELQPRKAEEERLSRVAAELQSYADHLSRNLEEFERTLAFLEEQRRQDSRRLSDVNGELLELTKRMEGQQSKVELLEELSRRNERSLNELSSTMLEFKQQRQSWMEQEALAAQKREQIMGDMVRRMDAFAGDMATFAKQVENWSETHRAMKKELDDFNRLVDRVERRLNEVSEMQRLSEERFRTEWEEFLQDDQKRWRQFTLTNEEAWRSNAKQVEDMLGQLARLGERTDRLLGHVKFLTTIQQEILRTIADSFQPIRERIDESTKTLSSLT